MDTSQAELEEEEAISGTGEGDEVMEEVEEQDDGYSCVSIHLTETRSLH
jgi:casein kinase II subunit beta